MSDSNFHYSTEAGVQWIKLAAEDSGYFEWINIDSIDRIIQSESPHIVGIFYRDGHHEFYKYDFEKVADLLANLLR